MVAAVGREAERRTFYGSEMRLPSSIISISCVLDEDSLYALHHRIKMSNMRKHPRNGFFLWVMSSS